MLYPGFIGEAYRAQSISAAGDLLINLYPEVLESKGDGDAVYLGTPGTALFTTLPKFPVRGTVNLPTAAGDACFFIGGSSLYQVSANGSAAELGGGGLPGGNSPVSMKTNGKQVAIAAGGQLWVWDGTKLAAIDRSLVPGAGTVSYSDGYFIVNVPGTNEFYISGLFDATSWNALDFGAKEGFPDLVVGQIVDHRELWLFGSRNAEIWWNSGAANFPWQRLQGPYIEAGLGAEKSLVKADNTVLWLHQDERGGRMIWRANGYTPQRVSTFALEYALGTYARVDDAVAYTYQENGHTFYVITFPSAYAQGVSQLAWNQPGLLWDQGGAVWDQGVAPPNYVGATWALDLSNNMWHQRDYLDPQFGFSQQVRGWCHSYAFGRHLVGDYQNGNIYDQSVNYFTDAFNSGAPGQVRQIRRLRRAPHIVKEKKWVSYPGFELHVQQGMVPQGGPGSSPQFNLRKSGDGGFTWSPYLEAAGGLAGQYRARVIWRRLGQATAGVFEASSDEPIQHAWINAYLSPDPVVSR